MRHTAVDAPPSRSRLLIRASRLAAAWALGYGLYRWYYAFGGTVGMLGTPRSLEQFRRINAIAGAILLVVAVLPLAFAKRWDRHRARMLLLAVSWVIAVACVSHALIGMTQRILSLAGILTIEYPFWRTIDRREADLQALLLNEPWFLVQGVLWGLVAWGGALRESPRRRWWIGSAVAATAASTAAGILSALGVIGKVIVG